MSVTFPSFVLQAQVEKTYLHAIIETVFVIKSIVCSCLPARSPLFGHFSTTLLGLDTIRAFGVEETFLDQVNLYQDAHTRAWFTFIATQAWLSYRLEILCVIFISFTSLISPALRDSKLPKYNYRANYLCTGVSCNTLKYWLYVLRICKPVSNQLRSSFTSSSLRYSFTNQMTKGLAKNRCKTMRVQCKF